MAHMSTSIFPGWLKGLILIGIAGILIGWIYMSATNSPHTSPSEKRIVTVEKVPDSPSANITDKARRNSNQLIFGNPLEQPPQPKDSPAGIIREPEKAYYKDLQANPSN